MAAGGVALERLAAVAGALDQALALHWVRRGLHVALGDHWGRFFAEAAGSSAADTGGRLSLPALAHALQAELLAAAPSEGARAADLGEGDEALVAEGVTRGELGALFRLADVSGRGEISSWEWQSRLYRLEFECRLGGPPAPLSEALEATEPTVAVATPAAVPAVTSEEVEPIAKAIPPAAVPSTAPREAPEPTAAAAMQAALPAAALEEAECFADVTPPAAMRSMAQREAPVPTAAATPAAVPAAALEEAEFIADATPPPAMPSTAPREAPEPKAVAAAPEAAPAAALEEAEFIADATPPAALPSTAPTEALAAARPAAAALPGDGAASRGVEGCPGAGGGDAHAMYLGYIPDSDEEPPTRAAERVSEACSSQAVPPPPPTAAVGSVGSGWTASERAPGGSSPRGRSSAAAAAPARSPAVAKTPARRRRATTRAAGAGLLGLGLGLRGASTGTPTKGRKRPSAARRRRRPSTSAQAAKAPRSAGGAGGAAPKGGAAPAAAPGTAAGGGRGVLAAKLLQASTAAVLAVKEELESGTVFSVEEEVAAEEPEREDPAQSESEAQAVLPRGPGEGYALRDLRRVVEAMLPRYGHLLSPAEHAALEAFSQLPLRAQQLYARLLGRKWPQWVAVEGLGARYRELGEGEAREALADLTRPALAEPLDLTSSSQPSQPSQPSAQSKSCELDTAGSRGAPPTSSTAKGTAGGVCVGPWLLDTSSETASSLLARPLSVDGLSAARAGSHGVKESYGTLLLEALPVAQLRQLASGIGLAGGPAQGRRGSKGRLLRRLCDAARRQCVLGAGSAAKGRSGSSGGGHSGQPGTTEVRLVAQALRSGRWVCVAPAPGRAALAALTELFHIETSGVADSSFVIFSTRWPGYSLEPGMVAAPLFAGRRTLDCYLAARRLVQRLEAAQEQVSAEAAATDAELAEGELRAALAAAEGGEADGEAAKLRSPFRRRFTAAWCWAEALHHAVMHAPAVGEDEAARAAKVRRLRLLLDSRLCVSRRGRWYGELAKELSRSEGAQAALRVAAEGLAEGEPPPLSARVEVDLTEAAAGPEEGGPPAALPALPRDARWELAGRCRALAVRLAPGRGRSRASAGDGAWRRVLRETPAARAKAAGGDDGGRWLPALVERLRAEEAAAAGTVRSIGAASLGLATDPAAKPGGGGTGGRRLFSGYDLAELCVEELALRHYLGGGASCGFACGLHCEGALLRDLFGILLFDQLFDTSVEGVFVSTFQDAPLDLGTEAFYPSRRSALERRLQELAWLPPMALAAEVRARFAELHGTRIRGVQWERYEGPSGVIQQRAPGEEGSGRQGRRVLWTRGDEELPECMRDLGAAAGALGGPALAAALRLLCEDHSSAGLPDLLVWSWPADETLECQAPPRARLVEVKSERDKLSRRQRLWLATLRGAGAEAEVCHVRDGPLEVPEGSRSSRKRSASSRCGDAGGSSCDDVL